MSLYLVCLILKFEYYLNIKIVIMKKKDLNFFREEAAQKPYTDVPMYVASKYVPVKKSYKGANGEILFMDVIQKQILPVRVNHARRMRRALQKGGVEQLEFYQKKVQRLSEEKRPILELHDKTQREPFLKNYNLKRLLK